jgi:hypothetical protein
LIIPSVPAVGVEAAALGVALLVAVVGACVCANVMALMSEVMAVVVTTGGLKVLFGVAFVGTL